MKRVLLIFAAAFLAFSFLASAQGISPDGYRLAQISTINAILAGEYDGVATMRQLIRFGNFGIGTVNAVDGELTLYNGVPYVTKSDGTVVIASNTETTPFASVYQIDRGNLQSVRFDKPMARAEFTETVDRLAANPNIFYAVLFEGNFVSVSARSEKKQVKPYRPLSEVMKTDEVRFAYSDLMGVLVGFRSPQFVSGLNVPGDHLHFLSSDRTRGGHAVDFVLRSGRISVQPIPVFTMYLSEDLKADPNELGRDRSEELNQVEK